MDAPAVVAVVSVLVGLIGWIAMRGRPARGHPLLWMVLAVAGGLVAGLLILPLIGYVAKIPAEPRIAGSSWLSLAGAVLGACAFLFIAWRGSHR